MATVIDRCKTEGIVDVFQVVKALRTSKPSVVPTMVSALIGANLNTCMHAHSTHKPGPLLNKSNHSNHTIHPLPAHI